MKLRLLTLLAVCIGVSLPVTHAQTAVTSFSLYNEAAVEWQTTPCPLEIQNMSAEMTGYSPRLKACTQTLFRTDGMMAGTFEASIQGMTHEQTTVGLCILAVSQTKRTPTCTAPVSIPAGATKQVSLSVPAMPADTQFFTINIVTDALQKLNMTNPVWKGTQLPQHQLSGPISLSTGTVMPENTTVNTSFPNWEYFRGFFIAPGWTKQWCSSVRAGADAGRVPLQLQQCGQYRYQGTSKKEELQLSATGTGVSSLLAGLLQNGYTEGTSVTGTTPRAFVFPESDSIRTLAVVLPFGISLDSFKIMLTAVPDVPPITTTPQEKTVFESTGVWEGRHVILRVHKDTAQQLVNPKLFVEKMDKMYEFYADLVGGVPYSGAKIKIDERCSGANKPPAEQCPWGYMTWYDTRTNGDYWGLAGNPIEIITGGMKSTVQLFNSSGAVTFGIAHEFGHDFDAVTTKPQYMFHTASVEAWANLKAMYAIDAAELPLELGGTVYETSKEIIDGFYRPFTQQYQDRNLKFDDLISEGPVAGSLTDYYIGVLLPLIDETGKDALFDTIKFYKKNEANIRAIPNTTLQNKYDRFGQFLLFWSCKSGKDLSASIAPYRFNVPIRAATGIQYCLQQDPALRTDAFIYTLDIQVSTMYIPGA